MISIPAFPSQDASPLRVSVLVASGDGSGELVRIRSTPDAEVYLGAVEDSEGQRREWVEIWVQSFVPLGGMAMDGGNAIADARWRRLVDCLARLDGARRIGGAWEREAPAPVFLDVVERRVVVPDGWALCRDEHALHAAGLGGYASTHERYLRNADGTAFLSVSGGAHRDGVLTWAEVLGGTHELVALNPACGCMLVRRLATTSFEAYVAWLTRARFAAAPTARSEALLADLDASVTDHLDGAGFVPTVGGESGRVAEVLYLKLRAIQSAVGAVRAGVEALDRPLFSLSSSSFGIEFAQRSEGFAFAWTARAVLDDVGSAVEIESSGTGHPRQFVARDAGVSVYRPAGQSTEVAARGRVRVRRAARDRSGGMVLEGALWSDEPLRSAPGTVAAFRVTSGGESVGVHALATREGSLAQGEIGFVSFPIMVDAEGAARLQKLEGVELPETPIRLVSAMSTPADLYSLGVVAIRTLVAGDGTGLGDAVDALLTLARELAASHDGSRSMGERIGEIVKGNRRLTDVLGPQRLVEDDLSFEDATIAIPELLWWEVLGGIVALLPGIGPDSHCESLGLGAEARLASVFEEPLETFGELVRRARALLCADWRTCEEIGTVLDRLRSKLGIEADVDAPGGRVRS